MRLCKSQKIVILIVIVSISFVLYVLGFLDLRTLFTELIVMAIVYWFSELRKRDEKPPVLDEEKLAKNLATEQQKLKEKEKYLKTLNDGVFTRWKNVSKDESEEFYVKIQIDENIDKLLLKDAIDFLEFKRKKYGQILELRKKIMELKKDYNCIGERIITEINSHLSMAYPSLKSIESRKLTGNENCYVINAIIFLIWYKLKKELLKEGQINWKTIILEEKKEGNIWRLKANLQYEYIIQSNDSEDVSKKFFKTTIENLIIKILADDLKQQDKLYEELNKDLTEFKNKVHSLSYDIEVNRV